MTIGNTPLKALKPTPKMTASTTSGGTLGLVTWLLVTGFWHNGLPPDVATVLPFLVAVVSGFVAGWLKKENIVIPPLQVPPPAVPCSGGAPDLPEGAKS